MPLLEYNNFTARFTSKHTAVVAADNVNISLNEGETLALVGESGSGKSVCAMSPLRLISARGFSCTGGILYRGVNLLTIDERELRRIRGGEISVVFQEPMTSLNPVFSIRRQLDEVWRLHSGAGKKEASQLSLKMLEAVGIAHAADVLRKYPHQLSGGMRQRVMIACALAGDPKILIADEPTTALDVTIEAQILKLIADLKSQRGMSVLFITHDLGVVSAIADRIAVMYCGQIVEAAPAGAVFGDARFQHPYTEGLISSIPSVKNSAVRPVAIPGAPPVPGETPPGCPFAPRCRYARPICHEDMPENAVVEAGHSVRCHFPNKEERHG